MILQSQLQFIRNKWHPLWRLRKMPLYRYLQRRFDFVSYMQIPETRDSIAVQFFRDFNWIVNSTNFEHEIRDTFKLVLDLIRPKVFWDIGANIGFYSWFVRQSPSIEKIVLFEPDPINYSLLQKTIHRNNIVNCDVLNVAVSDFTGDVTFVVDTASGATGSLAATSHLDNTSSLHSHYGMGHTITCQAVSIDGITDNMPLPDFIKIDVEGAEHLVIAGARTYLNQHKPTLIMETSNLNLVNEIHGYGYTVFQIDSGNFLFVSNHLEPIFKKISKEIPLYDLSLLVS